MIFRALCTWVCVSWASASLSQSSWDSVFQDSASAFLPPGYDHRLLIAQCYQESRLKPLAVSPAGAQGLCQFMPGTWTEVSKALSLGPADVWLPEPSILAAGYYMGKLHRTWSSPRPAMDRAMLAMSSYNAGAGNLIEAQKRCGMPLLYKDIVPCLPEVTGRHSAETIGYVDQIISRWYPAILFGLIP